MLSQARNADSGNGLAMSTPQVFDSYDSASV